MALSPTFKVCLKNKGTSFVFTDTTNVYSSSNPGGWGGPNIQGGDVVEAFIRITSPSGHMYDYDITSQIPDIVTSHVQFLPFDGNWEDGIYKFQLNILTENESFTSCITLFFTPRLDCCIDNILSKFVEEYLCDDCYDNDEIVSIMYFRDALHKVALTKNEKQIKMSLQVLQDLCNCL